MTAASIVVMCNDVYASRLACTLRFLVSRLQREIEVLIIDYSESGLRMDGMAASNVRSVRVDEPLKPYSFSSLRNIGISEARGTWIVTLDADCIPGGSFQEEVLATIRSSYKANPSIATSYRVCVDHRDAMRIASRISTGRTASMLEQLPTVRSRSNNMLGVDKRYRDLLQIERHSQPWDVMHGCNTMFLRAAALSVGMYDIAFDGGRGYEDIEFAHRLIRDGSRPVYRHSLKVFHQEIENDCQSHIAESSVEDRNCALVCGLIPGYARYKVRQYRSLGLDASKFERWLNGPDGSVGSIAGPR
jgi:glycosyltransferase involved in cell wall biosynthesis